jgi:hypothetical protein
MSLGIEIHDEDSFPAFRKRRPEIDNRGGLGAATFLSRYCEDHDAP